MNSETNNRSYSPTKTSHLDSYQKFLPIHQKALAIAKNLKRCEFEMIEILQAADLERGYRTLKFKSLFQYATLALDLSEDRAYMFITVARKAAGLALMQEALRKGELKVSKAKKLSSVITKENQKEWLDCAKNLSQRALERAIAKVNPKSQIEEGMKFVTENTLEFRAAIDIDSEILIKRVQDLLSQSLGRAATYNEVLKAMAKEFIKAKDPVVRAERILKRKAKLISSASHRTANQAEAQKPQSTESPINKSHAQYCSVKELLIYF